MAEQDVAGTRAPVAEDGGVNSKIPWFLRLLLIASLLMLLLTSASELGRWRSVEPLSANGPGPADQYIVPGLRIGFVTLNLPIQEVEARMGKARLEPTEKAVIYRWDQANLKCVVEGGRVTSILTTEPGLHTRTGLHVGSPVDEVIRSYGDGYEYDTKDSGPSASPTPAKNQPYVLHYFQQGVHFSVHQGAVRSIWVTGVLNS